jgi:hypothetical protein
MVEEEEVEEPRIIVEKVPIYIPVPQRSQAPVTIVKNIYNEYGMDEDDKPDPAPITYNKVIVDDDSVN